MFIYKHQKVDMPKFPFHEWVNINEVYPYSEILFDYEKGMEYYNVDKKPDTKATYCMIPLI